MASCPKRLEGFNDLLISFEERGNEEPNAEQLETFLAHLRAILADVSDSRESVVRGEWNALRSLATRLFDLSHTVRAPPPPCHQCCHETAHACLALCSQQPKPFMRGAERAQSAVDGCINRGDCLSSPDAYANPRVPHSWAGLVPSLARKLEQVSLCQVA